MSSIFLGDSVLAPLIQIRRDGKDLATVHHDGRVEYHGEYAPDEAARAFWEALSTFCPVRQYAEALAALSAEKARQAAQGGVSEAMVERARLAIMASNGFEPGSDGYINDSAIRAALEAALSAQQGQGEFTMLCGTCRITGPRADVLHISRIIGEPDETAPPAQPAERVPEGWALVPREPTEEMEAAHRIWGDTSDWWGSLLAASPAPSPARGDGGEA